MLRHLILLTLALLLPLFVVAQSAEDRVTKLDVYFAELSKNDAFSGTILIAEKGRPIYQKAFGLANEDTKTPNKLSTVFELASVSKQFTAMGIVQLQKEGKVSYDDPLVKHIPELAFYEGVTIRHLLKHTGGIPDYMDLLAKDWDKEKIATNTDIIKQLQEKKPAREFAPGEKWSYSNTGYLLLATVIERVSGRSFDQYLKQKIYKPLKMNNTFTYRRRYQPQKVKDYAEGYMYSREKDKKVVPDEIPQLRFVHYLDGIVGDGMVSSNLEDLLKWDQALYTDKLVNAADRELIFSSTKTLDGSETNYGFGWQIDANKVYGRIVSHSGSWPGYITFIDRHLDNQKTIIILQNNNVPNTLMPIRQVRKIIYGIPVEDPIELSAEELKSFIGSFSNAKGEKRQVIFENDKLFLQRDEKTKFQLIPLSKTRFLIRGVSPETTLEFILDANGAILKYKTAQLERDNYAEFTAVKD
ncbi:MAG: beta-lactamase family protein [Acidobacteria bacterium]|nr:beta-lactamase family protein [Acidobacteriota bacterium]